MTEQQKLLKLLVKYGVRHEVDGTIIYMPCKEKPRTAASTNGQNRLTLRRYSNRGRSRVLYASANADFVFLKIDPADAEAEGIEPRGYNGGAYRSIEYTAEDTSASRLTAGEYKRLRDEREEERAQLGEWYGQEH